MIIFGIWSIPFLVFQPFFYTEARYVAPVAIFLIIIAGRGVVDLLNWLGGMFPKADKRRVEWIYAIILFVILTPVMIYPLTHRGPKYDYPDLHKAGSFLAEYISKNGGSGILSVTPIIGYYADTKPSFVLPRTDIQGVVDFAKKKNIRFIALEERKVYRNRPELREMLYTNLIPPGLNLIYDNRDNSGYRVRIFDIQNADKKPARGAMN